MIHIDTHVVLWLYCGQMHHLSAGAQQFLRFHRPMVSPMVRLELDYLHQVRRINHSAAVILDQLAAQVDLGIATEDTFERIAAIASTIRWTRDPFDRIIVAHAMADDLPLLTKDATILAHCPLARWN